MCLFLFAVIKLLIKEGFFFLFSLLDSKFTYAVSCQLLHVYCHSMQDWKLN